MTRALILSRYARLGASSRLRTMQYLPALGAAGIVAQVEPLFDDAYVRGVNAGRVRLRALPCRAILIPGSATTIPNVYIPAIATWTGGTSRPLCHSLIKKGKWTDDIIPNRDLYRTRRHRAGLEHLSLENTVRSYLCPRPG